MEIDSHSFALHHYSLALLTLMDTQYVEAGSSDDNAPLGMAMRLNVQQTIYCLTAHRFLKALIEHSPSPEALARQLLEELAKCQNRAVKTSGDAVSTLSDLFYPEYYAQVDNLIGESPDHSVSPDDWAVRVNDELTENGGDISPVTWLASHYLTNLVIACMVQCNVC